MQFLTASNHKVGSDGSKEGAQSYTSQDEGGHGQGLPPAGKEVDHGHCRHSAGKGQKGDKAKAQKSAGERKKKADGCPQPCSLSYPNEIGVGQRVFKQALIGGSGYRQGCPGSPGQKNARKSYVQDDNLGRIFPGRGKMNKGKAGK